MNTVIYPEIEALRFLIGEQKKEIERLKIENEAIKSALSLAKIRILMAVGKTKETLEEYVKKIERIENRIE